MRRFLCLVSLLVSFYAGAQSTVPQPVLRVSGMSFAVSVADLKVSTDWYTTKLGLHVTKQFPRKNGAAVTLLEGGGLMVELIEREGSKTAAQISPAMKNPDELQGFFKVGIFIENYATVLGELESRGVAFAYGPWPAHDGQAANVIFRDNSGNLIQLMEK